MAYVDISKRDEWLPMAQCRGMDPNLFYYDETNPNDVPPEAKNACRICSVREECADWAIHHEAFGYQGGMTQYERARYRRNHRIILLDPITNLGIGIGSRA